MSKKVKFNLGDCPAPKIDVYGLLTLRSPLPFILKNGDKRTISLGIQCDHALLLVPPTPRTSISEKDHIVPAYQKIGFLLENFAEDDLIIEVGDTVARAYVLDNGKIVVE